MNGDLRESPRLAHLSRLLSRAHDRCVEFSAIHEDCRHRIQKDERDHHRGEAGIG
jgi:hypothetical protein